MTTTTLEVAAGDQRRTEAHTGPSMEAPMRYGRGKRVCKEDHPRLSKPERKNRAVIPLKFTTTDGQEVSLPDYAAVPIERLQKLEEIAVTAMKLIAVHNVALGGNISTTVEQAISDLTRDVRALDEIGDFDASIIEDSVQINSDEARIAAGH